MSRKPVHPLAFETEFVCPAGGTIPAHKLYAHQEECVPISNSHVPVSCNPLIYPDGCKIDTGIDKDPPIINYSRQ